MSLSFAAQRSQRARGTERSENGKVFAVACLWLVLSGLSLQSRRQMTPAQFKAKWAKFSGKESTAYQDHFSDLCRMLGVPTPIEADPTGNDSFCFQKRVAKDAELFDFDATGEALPASKERGFADVWKRDCFGWEYKGPGEDLEKAYKQLLRYRESLLNPPLLIVCDFHRYIVRTNFNGCGGARRARPCLPRRRRARLRAAVDWPLPVSREREGARTRAARACAKGRGMAAEWFQQDAIRESSRLGILSPVPRRDCGFPRRAASAGIRREDFR